MPISSQSVRKPSRVYLRRGHPLAHRLIGAWPFMKGAGSTLHDVSGYQHHGAGNNISTTDWGVGQPGRLVSFLDSNDTWFNCGQRIRELTGATGNDFSAAALVRPTTTSKPEYILCTGVDDGWYFRTSASSEGANSTGNDQFLYKIDDGSNDQFFTSNLPNGIQTDTWYLVSMTANRDGNLTGYVDAVEEGSGGISSVGAAGDGNDCIIGTDTRGGSPNNLDGGFDGDIALAFVWNRTLTAGEHAALYENPMAPFITKH